MSETVVIRGAGLLDVDAGEVLGDRQILIADGRIQAIQRAGEPTPDGAAALDLTGMTVLPGLIDCHSHLIGELEYAGIPATTTSAAEEAMTGVANARATIEAGFTSVRDVGTFRAFVDVALRNAIDRGWVIGPRMQCAGAYVTSPGGAGDVTGLALDIMLPADLRFGVVRSPAEARQKVRELVARGADLIKVLATGAVLTRGTKVGVVELDEATIRAVVEEANAHGVFVAAHAHGSEGIKVAIRAGVRSIEHGSLVDDEAIAMLADTGTYWVADLYCGDWIEEAGTRERWPDETLEKNRLTTDAQREGFRKAVAAGVRLPFGTDSGVYPHGLNARQLPYLVRYGMTTAEALRSATVVAAELMGWGDRVGRLAPGSVADLIGVVGDPLADVAILSDVPIVMKAGMVVKDARATSLPG
ncbi:MAG TPA: amidohydrolase family protein [Candidatus Limnocylindrales bacterium]|nr:amidohydrolase family protein [Candidatus Limnocylindrales bacterium]